MINKHLTWWEDYRIPRPTKRYVVIFNIFRDHLETRNITEYDTLGEALEEARLLNIYYQDTPKPQKDRSKHQSGRLGYQWIYPTAESRWWGYLVLDMKDAKLLKVGGAGMYISYLRTLGKKEFDLQWTDRFFRDPSEIPDGYLWDDPEEYDGWLQYRWGDGKNSLTYKEPELTKDPRHGNLQCTEEWSDALGRYVTITKRVMTIGWDDKLPERRQKGVIYQRPNGDPVLWPGEFGYDGDYSLYPWSLEEEVVEGISNYKYENREATNVLGDSLDLTSSSGLNLALELDKYQRKNEMDNIDSTSTDSM